MNSKTIEEVCLHRARESCYKRTAQNFHKRKEAKFKQNGTTKCIDKKSWPLTTPVVKIPKKHQRKGKQTYHRPSKEA